MLRRRPADRVLPVLLALGGPILLLPPGCRSAGLRAEAPRPIAAIDGLAKLEADGDLVHIARDAKSPRVLLVHGQPREEVLLRTGDRFVLGVGEHDSEGYEILIITSDRITLRRVVLIDRRATGEGLRREQSVVAVVPYGPKRPDSPANPRSNAGQP